jgi:hypothetical protein
MCDFWEVTINRCELLMHVLYSQLDLLLGLIFLEDTAVHVSENNFYILSSVLGNLPNALFTFAV